MDDVLAGNAGADGVREVAQNPFQFGVRELLAICTPTADEVSTALLRTKYKPGRKLTASYELTIDGAGSRHACVLWTAAPNPVRSDPAARPTHTDRRGLHRDPAPGLAPLEATSQDGRLKLLVAPGDPAFPQLRTLADPDQLVTVLGRITGQTRPTPRAGDVRTVRYRPGQRHVLLARPTPGHPGVFVKCDRDDSGRVAVPVARAMAPLVADECPGVDIVEPVGYLEAERAAVWKRSPGAPLTHTLTERTGEVGDLVILLGRFLRTWHDSGHLVSRGLQRQVVDRAARDVAGELRATHRAGELIAVLRPDVWATYDAVLTEVTRALDALRCEAATLIHGDLKSDNVLVAGGRLHVLDLDRAAWADPALDLGKFMADLHWWCRDPATASGLGAAFRRGYGVTSPQRWARAGLISVMYRLAFAARRCAVHAPDWDKAVARRVDEAASALHGGWSR
ncbi:MAG: phosphotransferase [Nocardioidaceae bacterium]